MERIFSISSRQIFLASQHHGRYESRGILLRSQGDGQIVMGDTTLVALDEDAIVLVGPWPLEDTAMDLLDILWCYADPHVIRLCQGFEPSSNVGIPYSVVDYVPSTHLIIVNCS